MKKIMASLTMVATIAIGGTFQSIPFNQQTYSDTDPLGVEAIRNLESKGEWFSTTNHIQIESKKVNFKASIEDICFNGVSLYSLLGKTWDYTTKDQMKFYVKKEDFEEQMKQYVKIEDLKDGLIIDSIEAPNLTINGKPVALEDHKHNTADIVDLYKELTLAGYATSLINIPSRRVFNKKVGDLFINKLTQKEYNELKSNNKIKDEQLYFVERTDGEVEQMVQKIESAKDLDELKKVMIEFVRQR